MKRASWLVVLVAGWGCASPDGAGARAGEATGSASSTVGTPPAGSSLERHAGEGSASGASRGWASSAVVASASGPVVSASAKKVSGPRFLKENPKCAVPEGYDRWSWRRVHRVEGLSEKAVVLTLDVGARLSNLEKVLDLLGEAKVRTTIFLYTGELERSPKGAEIVRRMIRDGHELANHTRSHKDLSKMALEEVDAELDGPEKFVRSVDPKATTHPFFREPYLATNEELDKHVLELCYRTIWFTVDTGDWKEHVTADGILRNVFERRGKPREIETGSIFIFHGSQKENLVALPKAIARLREQGFSFLTLGEALRRVEGAP